MERQLYGTDPLIARCKTGDPASQTFYADYKINQLNGRAIISSTYGDIKIRSVGQNFKQANITATYADLFMGIPKNLPLKVNINLSYGDLKTNNIPLKEERRIEKRSTLQIQASSPNAGSNACYITVSGSYADVTLSEE